MTSPDTATQDGDVVERLPSSVELQELMDFYRPLTPGAPDWYRAVDHVVGVLLATEILRAKAREALSPSVCDPTKEIE